MAIQREVLIGFSIVFYWSSIDFKLHEKNILKVQLSISLQRGIVRTAWAM